MSLELTRFAVIGLHGKTDINIPVTENKLILIGVNGLGKTTVVNLIYFLLTAQWGRLLEFEFVAIELDLNRKSIRIVREDIQAKMKLSDRYEKVLARWAGRSPYPQRLLEKVFSHPLLSVLTELPSSSRDKVILEIARDLELPSHHVMRIFTDLPRSVQDDLFTSDKDTPAMADFLAELKEAGNHQVIYLPTYRRIEQDIKAIFPNLDDDELKKITARTERMVSSRNRGHIELIQFGMQDVERKIAEELEAIRENTRSQLSNLTASYLKDIIGNRADAITAEEYKVLDDKIVAAVLARVEENTLSIEDKREVQSAIRRIRAGDAGQEVRDKYLAYFFSRLLAIYLSLAQSEGRIRNLVETCNRYFARKALNYNDSSFTVQVLDRDGTELSWKVLSSGEKQVASLFTHLFLSKNTEQIVVIDEPELSLSVQWQKSLLPDISDSENCKLLIAVTHSPFVYANKLDSYVVDLSKCISVHTSASHS